MTYVDPNGISSSNVVRHLSTKDVLNRCFLYRFTFGSVFEKKSDSVRNEFGSVQFEKNSISVRIL